MTPYLMAAFYGQCVELGVKVPEVVERGLELLAVVESYDDAPTGPLLGMSEDEIRDRITAHSIRAHDTAGRGSTVGMKPGIDIVRDQLCSEVRDAALPEVEQIITDLQPRFDELAAPFVVAAREFGFTYATSSDDVIDRADERASAAWRDARTAWNAINPIVRFRIAVSTTFQVAPLASPGSPADYSAAFAAAENWAFDGKYYLEGRAGGHIDWFALAAGGLRLNTPREVEAKVTARRNQQLAALPAPRAVARSESDLEVTAYSGPSPSFGRVIGAS